MSTFPTTASETAITETAIKTFRGTRLATKREEYVGKRHNGDQLAVAMVGMTPRQVVRYANYRLGLSWNVFLPIEEAMGVTDGLFARYAHLNEGQKRMNAANLLRGAIGRGEVPLETVLRELASIPKLDRCVMKGGKNVVTHVSLTDALRTMATMMGKTTNELVEAGADVGNPGILADGTEVAIDYCSF